MNNMYYIKISELPVISSRRQQEFDNIILEYIEKFKEITTQEDLIAHLIATSIDYPYNYVKDTIETYKRSNLLTQNLIRISNKESFVREKEYIKSKEPITFIYNKDEKTLTKVDQQNIKEYESKKDTIVELDDTDYLEIYNQIFYCDDFFDYTTKEKDKYLMSLTLRKLQKNESKTFLREKIEFWSLKTLTEPQIVKIKSAPEFSQLRIQNRYREYEEKYQFIKDIKSKGYYQYNLAQYQQTDSHICDKTIVELLDIAKESIFIITTKIDNKNTEQTKAFEKFNTIKEDTSIRKNKKLYIRTIEGFQKSNNVTCEVEQDKKYYSQTFNTKSHSKIIIIDNFFVALGSGNWFSNNRNEYEDSLIIFPCMNAIKKYCPIYFPHGDYYKIFEDLINNTNDLIELFHLYLIMKKDLEYDMSNSQNCYDELLIKKLEQSMENNIKDNFEYIETFLKRETVNRRELLNYLLTSDKVAEEYKEQLKEIAIEGDDN